MLYEKFLHKVFSKIPGVTDEEAALAVDSVVHANELSFRNATKNMATKDDIKNMATKDDIKDMATKDDIRDLESRMATKDDIRDLESRMATKDDIKDIESKMATKDDIKYMATQNELSKMETRMVAKISGLVLGGIVVIVAIVGLIIRLSPPLS